jgi:hypothetical protein
MNDSTFDDAKNYKRICYREDRDLLNTELNEMQDVAAHDRTVLFDRILAPGAILSGLAATATGSDVTITDGSLYIDGCAVEVPGATLSFEGPGEHIIYVDVFRRDITASEDPTLVNPLTGEPTAEREKWIATLQARDTFGDPLPTGAKGRSVAAVHIFNRDTGEVIPAAGGSGDGGSIFSDFANHAGHGGLDRHPAATDELAGFMTPEQVSTVADHETRLDAAESDLTDLSGALTAHKTSSDHDSRYYTETESNARFAPIAHVGSAGTTQHPAATGSAAGFMSSSDKTKLDGHETRLASVEAALPGKADDADVTAVQNSLNTHKTSGDHDSRYYTEAESDGRFAPSAHVGSGGGAHALATVAQAGFLPKEIFEFLTRLNFWNGRYDYGNDGAGAMYYSMVSGRDGMIWKGRCDSNSTHIILTDIRSIGSPITAMFEFYHMVGTVTMQTGSRIRLSTDPPTIPGGKVYLVDLDPDTFTNIVINVSGSGDVGFALRMFPGDDRQICFDVDPDRAGKAIVV